MAFLDDIMQKTKDTAETTVEILFCVCSFARCLDDNLCRICITLSVCAFFRLVTE